MKKPAKKKTDKVYVQIVNDETQKCAQQMGPMSRAMAEDVRMGAMINMNNREWSVLISTTKRKVSK
jgi:hypothetical protein